MSTGISIPWSPELEAQYQEWEKTHHACPEPRRREAGVREVQEFLGLPDAPMTTLSGANSSVSPLENPVSKLKGHNPMGRPPTAEARGTEATKKVEQVIRNLARRKYQKLGDDYANAGVEIFEEQQFARDLGILPEDLEKVMSVQRATPIFGNVGMMFAPTEKEMEAVIPKLAEYLNKKMGRPPKTLDPAILHGPGSLRQRGYALGVSPMTVMRRLRKGGLK